MASPQDPHQGLNPEQREAVLHDAGPLLIFAGAGSGKTRVICHRIAHAISARGIRPFQILGVTFTNKAAAEMRARVEGLVGRPCRDIWLSTFHAAAVRILRAHYGEIGGDPAFSIYDDDDQKSLLKNILKSMGLDPKIERPEIFRERIDRAKDDLLSPDEWLERQKDLSPMTEKTHAIFRDYEKRLRAARALDFGGLLSESVRLLTTAPGLLDRFRARFRQILVDEFQDTNRAQYAMVRLLAPPESDLAVVGDDDQSVYGWRGARVEHILHDFRKDYPSAKVVVLKRNYRSTPQVLAAASRLIAENPSRPPEKAAAGYLVAVRGAGVGVRATALETEYEEADWIVREIERLAKSGVPRREIAIFYRIHALSRVLEEILSTRRIPYQIAGGISFYQRAEIKDVLAHAKVLVNPADGIAFRRVFSTTQGLGETSVAKLESFASEKEITTGEALRRIEEIEGLRSPARRAFTKLYLVLNQIRRELAAPGKKDGPGGLAGLGAAGILSEILDRTEILSRYDPDDPDDEARIENCQELLSAAREHEASGEDPSLAAFLENVSLATDVDRWDPEADRVTLATVHAAKGLEFTAVFVAGMEEGLFPHVRISRGASAEADMEEERRLAYVAMTRAKDHLALTRARTRRIYGEIQGRAPSRFFEEAGLGGPPGLAGGEGPPARFDTIRASARFAPRAPEPSPSGLGEDDLTEGDRVLHRSLGEGLVMGLEGAGEEAIATVKFRGGVKRLLLKYAGLARPEAR